MEMKLKTKLKETDELNKECSEGFLEKIKLFL